MSVGARDTLHDSALNPSHLNDASSLPFPTLIERRFPPKLFVRIHGACCAGEMALLEKVLGESLELPDQCPSASLASNRRLGFVIRLKQLHMGDLKTRRYWRLIRGFVGIGGPLDLVHGILVDELRRGCNVRCILEADLPARVRVV